MPRVASRDDSSASLRAFRKAIRYTTKELAEAIGVPEGRYKNWEYGRANPPAQAVRELRKLGYGAKAQPRADTTLGTPSIPVGFSLGTIPFAGIVPAGEWGDPLASEEFIEVEVKFEHPRRFAAKVVGDSCYPALMQGDVTIWHQDMNPPFGSIVLAQRRGDHGCTVKELRYEDGRPVLHPVNPAHAKTEDGTGWGVIARLVGVIRKVDGLEQSWYLADGIRVRHLVTVTSI